RRGPASLAHSALVGNFRHECVLGLRQCAGVALNREIEAEDLPGDNSVNLAGNAVLTLLEGRYCGEFMGIIAGLRWLTERLRKISPQGNVTGVLPTHVLKLQ